MSKIYNKDFLIEGSCYKKADTGKYLGKYKGAGGGEPRWGVATDYAYFENDTFLLNEIDVIEVPCQSAPTIQTTSAALGAGTGTVAGPMIQQQWLSYTQLIPGKCYMDQNRVYLGKYSGTNNAFFDALQYTIIHRFEKVMLAGMNWKFWEVSCQAGGKRSKRRYTKKH